MIFLVCRCYTASSQPTRHGTAVVLSFVRCRACPPQTTTRVKAVPATAPSTRLLDHVGTFHLPVWSTPVLATQAFPGFNQISAALVGAPMTRVNAHVKLAATRRSLAR
jgi:hypothetical protein